MVVVQQRFSVDARTHVVVRQTEKVDFQSTGSEPLALQARVVQLTYYEGERALENLSASPAVHDAMREAKRGPQPCRQGRARFP